jgi:hypothetical protein
MHMQRDLSPREQRTDSGCFVEQNTEVGGEKITEE